MRPWPLWIVFTVLLATGCPLSGSHNAATRETPSGPAGGGESTSAPTAGNNGQEAPVDYPPAALAYFLDSLRKPATAEYPPLEQSWLAIAQLTRLEDSPAAGALDGEVGAMVAAAGDNILPQLAAAWLAVDRQPAEEFIAKRLADGEPDFVNSLMYAPQSARRVLEAVNIKQLDSGLQLRIVRLLVQLRPLSQADAPLLAELAASEDEDVRLQAAGLQLAQDPDAEEARQLLWDAVRKEQGTLSGAAEGIKLSADPRLADALVPLAAAATMGDEDPAAETQHRVVFAAYALTYLPGEQAQLMRRKLLGAVDPTVRWAARLGELLHGDPSYWNTAVDKHGVDDTGLWLALQPADVMHIDLVPTLLDAARSEKPETRLRAARQLNRYAADASSPAVNEVLKLLIADQVSEVSSAAWYAAGRLAADGLTAQAATALEDRARAPELRLAAAFYAMRVAEARVEEVTQ